MADEPTTLADDDILTVSRDEGASSPRAVADADGGDSADDGDASDSDSSDSDADDTDA